MFNYLSERVIDLRGNNLINPGAHAGTRNASDITELVIHHNASIRPDGDYSAKVMYEAEAREHNEWGHGTIGRQYHDGISASGYVFACRPAGQILWHAGHAPTNNRSIAICLDGFFHPPHNQWPTREQYEALYQRIQFWRRRYPKITRVRIIGHRERSGTACNGDNFFPFVTQYRESKSLDSIIPSHVEYRDPDSQPREEPEPEIEVESTTTMDKPLEVINETRLVEIPSGEPLHDSDTYKEGETISAVAEKTKWSNGKSFYRTKWAVDNDAMHGFPASSLASIEEDDKVKDEEDPDDPRDDKEKKPAFVKELSTEGLPKKFKPKHEEVALRYIKDGNAKPTDAYGEFFDMDAEFMAVERVANKKDDVYLRTEFSKANGVWNGVLEDDLRPKSKDDYPENHQDIPEGKGDLIEFIKDGLQRILDIIKRFLSRKDA